MPPPSHVETLPSRLAPVLDPRRIFVGAAAPSPTLPMRMRIRCSM
jgi:hypothetical protein